ncbi:hypothetical protein BDQ12DRAFT_685125 [Crucibulum laeve]|uniref:BAG domain-containing protein n=1 Tax=Crucibulum laeve TaxID=68775 RepID=A0A5C3LWS9_9AGAR|nr:hypothetical protein BDQ12DRAFT_685125 [Crucibulum laeve]
MYSQPYYRSFPPNVSYNPYLHSSYTPSTFPQHSPEYSPYNRSVAQEHAAHERARALAEQRARRHQYLPEEDEDSEDEWAYNHLSPREQAYVDARRKKDIMERAWREREAEEARRALEEKKWQEALERRQKEDEAARQHLLEEWRQAQREKHEEAQERAARAEAEKASQQETQQPLRGRSSSLGPSEDSHSIPIRGQESSQAPAEAPSGAQPISHPEVRPPTPKPQVLPEAPKLPQEEQHKEVSPRTQKRRNVRHSFATLRDLEKRFEDTKKNFTYPSTLDFQKPGSEGGTITIPADSSDSSEPMDIDGRQGKLAYTSANYPLHQYVEALCRILMELDGVESWGKMKLRERRRSIVKRVEEEATRVEWYWKNAWRKYLEKEESTETQNS